jgi:hypothetical protein
LPISAAPRPLARAASLLALAAAPFLACAANRSGEPFTLVGMDEVERMLSQPDVAIVDANTRETFLKNHLPGARYYKSAPFEQVLPADKSTRIVFYCASPG